MLQKVDLELDPSCLCCAGQDWLDHVRDAMVWWHGEQDGSCNPTVVHPVLEEEEVSV